MGRGNTVVWWYCVAAEFLYYTRFVRALPTSRLVYKDIVAVSINLCDALSQENGEQKLMIWNILFVDDTPLIVQR
jgi:hypothetical protein